MEAAVQPPMIPAAKLATVDMGNMLLAMFFASLLIFSLAKNLTMLIELPFQKDLMPSLIFMALAQSKIP
jgi:hypothetical protein